MAMLRERDGAATRAGNRVRIALLAVGIPQVGIGLWALLAPRSWYDNFPGGGLEWLPPFGPYNEHFAADIGSSLTALGVLLVLAAVVLERRAIEVAAIAYVIWQLPHTIYHVANADRLPTGESITNLVTLALAIAVPLAVVAMVRGERTASTSEPREATR